MLEEAKATRERVLADLIRRRGLLQAQVDELRNGRDHLLDAYRTVKRTFLEATESLSQVEARAAAGRPIPSVDPEDVDAIIAAERAALVGTDPEHPAALAEVETLFARIRAGHGEAGTATIDAADGADGEHVSAPEVPGPADATSPTAGATPAPDAGPDPDDATQVVDEPVDVVIDLRADALPADVLPPAQSSAIEAWRAGRARTIDPLMSPLLKRAKRAAQDDQNALLDAVRRHKGRPNASQVLASDDAVRAAWEVVLRETIDAAYGAGRVAAGSEASPASDDAANDAVAVVVGPLRARLAVAIDSGEEGDTGGLVERIGARYREWKNQSLEAGLRDALAGAWTRGVFDATPDGEMLHWIPLVEGRCSDCDDNALEPTVKGVEFPTGQMRPPAHPGCRCLLAPATILAGAIASLVRDDFAIAHDDPVDTVRKKLSDRLIAIGVNEAERAHLTACFAFVQHSFLQRYACTSAPFRDWLGARQRNQEMAMSSRIKSRKEYTLLGTRVMGVDVPKIVRGQPLYGIDQKVPGMLYATYTKAPATGGKVAKANLDDIKKMPGVKDAFVVQGNGRVSELMPGVAIVANSTWAAIKAKRALKVEWDESEASKDSWTAMNKQAHEIAKKTPAMALKEIYARLKRQSLSGTSRLMPIGKYWPTRLLNRVNNRRRTRRSNATMNIATCASLRCSSACLNRRLTIGSCPALSAASSR
jgi:hypothetical protein